MGFTCPYALADDTEIFIGGADGATSTNAKPNVLFILDNSGSMSGASYNEDGSRSQLNRMDNMKVAFDEVMRSATGLNVGLMTFNNYGGSIIYPVEDIDKELISEANKVSNIGMTTGNDDAVELKSSGNVYLHDETLTLAHTPNREVGQTIQGFVHKESDNSEEDYRGYIPTNQYQFNMNEGHINGLRYHSLGIPQGATIINARLDFYSPLAHSNFVQVRIRGEDTKNPVGFTGNRYDISSRLSRATSEYVDWTIEAGDDWYANNRYKSKDIAAVIQEIVNRDDWQVDDPMVLLVQHISNYGHRAGTLVKDNRSNTQGPNGQGTLLHITYSTGAAPQTHQILGLRFDNVEIPAGANVTSAAIHFNSAADNTTADAVQIQVQAENTGDALPFEAVRNNLSSRTKFADIVTWHPDDEWTFEQNVQGPDVQSLVQRVVSNASGWCGGNAMAFYLEPSTPSDIQSRLAYAFESKGKQPTLSVTYTGGQNGCIQKSWATRIASQENDASQYRNNNADNNNNSIRANSNYTNGLRFEDIPLEQGTRAVDAYIEFTAYDSDAGDAVVMQIAAEDDDNAGAFPQSRRNISNRNLTSQTVNWTMNDWEQGKVYRTPNLSHIINEITARNGWDKGNAIAFIESVVTNSGERRYYTFDGAAGNAPRLVIRAENGAILNTPNTVRSHEIELSNDLNPRGNTPIVDTLLEAAFYFSGQAVGYGRSRYGSRYGRVSHPLSYTGGSLSRNASCSEDNFDSSSCSSEQITGSPQYVSPITTACQSSHVVLLTDGAANGNVSQNYIATFTGESSCANDASDRDEQCGRTLAKWMANTDLNPSLPSSINNVKTHTVAFNLSNQAALNFLGDLAEEGDGGFYDVQSAQGLVTAFDSIIRSVRSTASTFVAPGATVNQFNRLSHRSEVYFSVFKPDASPRWDGNLKRYKLLGNPPVVSDVNDKAAVDENTGFFKETAQSVWSNEVDGARVSLGGSSANRPGNPDNLKMFTYLTQGIANKNLTASVNKLHESNTQITEDLLDVSSTNEREEILQWARGLDIQDINDNNITAETRKQYEDPLHSVPHIITYGGTDENPDTAIFFGTNGGYLHAVNGTSGAELFSFTPESLLANFVKNFDSSVQFIHPYGVDGSPISWVHDANNDNQISVDSDDHAYLYFGLRRGGNEYFGMDVTNRNRPKILWHIEGGSGDFADMGQSWSTPVHTKIRYDGGIKDVLVFGGGYDTAYDSATYTGIGTGNAIYVVDATTGERLWYASSNASSSGQRIADMQYSIPADVSIIDINGDGLAEQIYAADLGGQVFRFDVNTTATNANWIQGGVIAKLSQTTSGANRRFFTAPDISLVDIAGKQKLAVAIGSGSRPTPLARIAQNRFYVFLQDSIFKAPQTYTIVRNNDLIDQSTAVTALTRSDQGWYIDLPNSGEKILSASVTLANKIVFTSYSPDSTATSCNPVIGTGRVYVVNLINGAAVADLNEDDLIDPINDRVKTLASGNIPPSPKVLFPEDGAPTVLIGPEQPLQKVNFGLIEDWTQIYRRPEDVEQ